ncbi:DUF982 domain-containing protein [Mesorhizobium sp. IMUNJ 23033]|uniref:DUF982 domain-containing protein n=1 Tax=Mesorhizobium sp. IMUNJ 23033 TaxID=3378039 RepID=UPI0038514075
MQDPFFEEPVMIETANPGAYRTLVSVSEAAIFMMESWPGEHGQRHRVALQACTGHLTNPEKVETARQAFLAAAEEAGLVVLKAEPAVKATRRPAGDAKRKNRARMEEEEDFMVRFLARETGITETQARDLINMMGADRSSLLREARILKAQH